MPAVIKWRRAAVSFAFAACVPFLVSWARDPQTPASGPAGIVVLLMMYSVALFAVCGVGLPTLLITLRFGFRPLASALVAGLLAGIVLTLVIYRQGFSMDQLVQMSLAGLATAVTAVFIYFRNPWTRPEKSS